MKHIAIDLETMGISPLAPIMAIGAVEFEIGYDDDAGHYFQLGREFYVRVDLQSNLDLGMLPDASTMQWWLTKTSQEAREALFNGEVVSISKALSMFSSWFPQVQPKPGVFVPDDSVLVWARGQDFDIGIMRTAYKLARMPHPWYYNKARDSRTLIEAVGLDQSTVPANTDAHNALSDAKWEAKAISFAMLQQIRLHERHTSLTIEKLASEAGHAKVLHPVVIEPISGDLLPIHEGRGPLECRCLPPHDGPVLSHDPGCPVSFVEPNSITG